MVTPIDVNPSPAPRRPWWRGHRRLQAFLGLAALVFILVGLVLVVTINRHLSRFGTLTFRPPMATILFDQHGQEFARVYKENRIVVPITEIPQHLQQAVVAIEDARFYRHHGVDFIALMRALTRNLAHLRVVEGGSTITAQLARNAFLTLDRTLVRKLLEFLLAIQIERKYSKEEILAAYLNQIYFGEGPDGEALYGVEAAARAYFGKSASQLSLAESAQLAGLIRHPGYYSPVHNPETSRRRRNFVIEAMVKNQMISREEGEQAKAEPVQVRAPSGLERQVATFVDYVVQYLRSKYGDQQVYTGGLRVYTTLDVRMQQEAVRALQTGLQEVPRRVDENGIHQPQAALVTLDPATGAILAMVGGTDGDKFNRAVQALRQPGSAIKPFVYLVAIQQGFGPGSVMDDSPVSYPKGDGTRWSPQNDDKRFRGPITLQRALEDSVNVIAVKLLHRVGIRPVLDAATKAGLSTLVSTGEPNDANLALALGGVTHGVSPLMLAQAYAAFANGGRRVEPFAVVRVTDAMGRELESTAPQVQRLFSERSVATLVNMLRGVIARGTGTNAQIGRPAAGKTGTTSDYTNVWFAGFTPHLVTVVWIGNDQQGEGMRFENGYVVRSTLAAAIWGDYMRRAAAPFPPLDFRLTQ